MPSRLPPIDNILKATDAQFVDLHQMTPSTKLSQEQFVEEFHKKQKMAQNDLEELKKLGVSREKLLSKLAEIMDKALQQYEPIYEEWKSMPWEERENIEDSGVIVDKTFKVKGLDPRLLLIQELECPICPTIISNPTTCEIENLKNGQKMSIPSLSMHFLEVHHYMAQGKYRIEPALACAVLGL